jgi:hypothetical protein
VEQVGALMDAETWMTAEETVESGFAERSNTPEGDTADLAASFGPVLAKFRRVPAQIAARYAPGDDDEWRRRKNRLRSIEVHAM